MTWELAAFERSNDDLFVALVLRGADVRAPQVIQIIGRSGRQETIQSAKLVVVSDGSDRSIFKYSAFLPCKFPLGCSIELFCDADGDEIQVANAQKPLDFKPRGSIDSFDRQNGLIGWVCNVPDRDGPFSNSIVINRVLELEVHCIEDRKDIGLPDATNGRKIGFRIPYEEILQGVRALELRVDLEDNVIAELYSARQLIANKSIGTVKPDTAGHKEAKVATPKSSTMPGSKDIIFAQPDGVRKAMIHSLSKSGEFQSLSQKISNEASQSLNERAQYYSSDDTIIEVARHFDRTFYLENNQDVRDAGVDPVEHYHYTGWSEGRDPAPWFSTAFYTKTYEDIASAKINPFWHYLVAGRAEGRLPKKTESARRRLLEEQQDSDTKVKPALKETLAFSSLLKEVSQLSKSRGVIVSVSHDCYVDVVGGTQVFISDEQRNFNQDGFSYVQLSPAQPSLVLNTTAGTDGQIHIVIDGHKVGFTTYRALVRAMRLAGLRDIQNRYFTLHCALGHSIEGIIAVGTELGPAESYLWLHDYSTLCGGFNLLRNNVKFCNAPPLESEGCRICIHGEKRAAHIDAFDTMFRAFDFTVVSPSKAALAIWTKSTALPHKGSVVVPHSKIDPLAVTEPDERPVERIGFKDAPVRVAYIGYPLPHKGWQLFEAIMTQCHWTGGYQFFQFASPEALVRRDNLTCVEAQVTASSRDAVIQLLIEHKIDIVVMPAIWPETFSFVTFEALASGADVFTISDSGNVAAAVIEQNAGAVFPNESKLLECFTSHVAVVLVRARQSQRRPKGNLLHVGTTAALVFDRPGAAAAE